MSDWTPPPTPQDYAGPASDPMRRLLDRLNGIAAEVNEMRNNLLKTAGMTVTPNGLTIDSELLVTGATRIEGALSLPAGIIDNDALANPVEFGSVGLSATAFPIGATYATVASGTLDIPPGFTSAAILGVVSLGAWNPTASGTYVYARALIDGSPGGDLPEFADPSSYRAVTASAIRTLTGLTPGGTIPVGIQVRAGAALGSSASNIAHIDVIALFRR